MSKAFPGVQALLDVALEVGEGEIHALLGENGAGKSTLLKILSGAQSPDKGTIRFAGETITLPTPQEAQARGIVTIYQEFNLVPSLSVAENVFIGREPVRAGFVDWGSMRRQTSAIIERVGLAIGAETLVSELSVAEQQMVEIARALSMDSRLIIMDEPTSALSDAEVERLFDIVRGLKARGISVIFVTHRLEEVMTLCDQLTVLRDGQLIGSAEVGEVGIDDIIKMMVGREVEQLFKHRAEHQEGAPVLEVRGITRAPDTSLTRLDDISFEIRHGEIVGLAGLVGAGRTELARAIFGADPIDAGEVLVEGRSVPIASPNDAIRAGIGLVPEDRKQQALFLALAVKLNLTISALERLAGRFGFLRFAEEDRLVALYQERLNIRMASPEVEIANLSGGNQQKVILARWLAMQPRVLIVDEPTRGIDVAAKAEVHQLLYELADTGIAILAISSELPEIMTISDRIITMREGSLTGMIEASEATEERLMAMMALSKGRAA